jgi:enamine deaminase RidA (YjgF/YER057c/UK114 family)
MSDSKIVLPAAPAAVSKLYKPFVLQKPGQVVSISGQISDTKGQVSNEATANHAAAAAKQAGLNVCAQINAACGGDLSRFVQLLHLQVMVNSVADFTEAHMVANSVSQLIKDWLLQEGIAEVDTFGTRVAASHTGLPLGVTVEVSCTFVMKG